MCSCGHRRLPIGRDNKLLYDKCYNCRGRRSSADRVGAAEKILDKVSTGPTSSVLHSPERLAVMIRRADAGMSLWNEDDINDD